MPGATVIDQLIVKLGLDPRDFDKGRKRAAAEVVRLEQDVKKSTGSMSASFVGLTGKVLGVATAAIAIKKTIGYVGDLAQSVRQLGIDARNFGVAANEFRNFQNIAELFGGKGEEVTRTIGGITKAVYDLAYNGVISDSLIMLGRLGVRFQDTSGKARGFRDIVLDTEAKIQAQLKSGSLSRENAGQILAQAGFDPGLSQAILSGNVRGELARQESRNQVTKEVVDAATAGERSSTDVDQAVAAAALRALPDSQRVRVAANEKLSAAADYAGRTSPGQALDDAANGIKEGAKKVADVFSDIADSFEGALFPKGRANYENTIQTAAKRHGIDPELLAGVLSTESNFNPSARSAAGARGIAQLMPKYFPGAGKNPHEDIDTAAAYLRALRDSFMQSEGADEAGANYLALQAYNAGQSRVRKAMAGGKPLAQETLDYPGKVLGYAAGAVPTPDAHKVSRGGAGDTEVNIDRVIVNTQATDANGIARDFAGSVRNKMNAAQAETGMN